MNHNGMFSRRDFLRLSGLGFFGLLLPNFHLNAKSAQDVFPPNQQGRVTSNTLWVYDHPSFKGKQLKMYWRDLILPIENATINEDDPTAYNRVWYEIKDQGFAYSGYIQPVLTILNEPRTDIPTNGVLGEVTVPYSDALQAPRASSGVGYRIYYETVHWIMAAVQNPDDGQIWYQILDDKWDKLYYVPAEYLRVIPDEELAPLSQDVPDDNKHIEVHLNDQILMAYEYDNPVFITRVASGAVLRVGTYYTPRGSFMTYHKRPTRHMAAGDITASGFDLPGVPWVMYFSESGLSLHGTYWHNDFGHPHSHGCVNLSIDAAKWLFRWTSPVMPIGEEFVYKSKGTQLVIQD
ncbi:MAG TPA: L,D-transpeptidase [Anaerolineales bacterium]|nr:L,D-transpeptidase [Anaerolineales bacterium]